MAPRGVRNNNFGNIEDGPFARGLPGYAGGDGRFAVFETPDHGWNAMDVLLTRYGQKGINSIAGVINRWAPASDGNNVATYANYVAKSAGLDPNAPLDLFNPEVRRSVARGMAAFENGTAALDGGAPVAKSVGTAPALYAPPAPNPSQPDTPVDVASAFSTSFAPQFTTAQNLPAPAGEKPEDFDSTGLFSPRTFARERTKTRRLSS